jgi:hypothetical protein
MGRTAIAWGSAAAHNLAAYSQSELGFATNFNIYPEVQLPSPNGSLGHTRGLVNCAVARSKALINAVMPVYFVWNKVAHLKWHGQIRWISQCVQHKIQCNFR